MTEYDQLQAEERKAADNRTRLVAEHRATIKRLERRIERYGAGPALDEDVEGVTQ